MTVAEQELEAGEVPLEDREPPSEFSFLHLFGLPKVVWKHLTDSRRKSTQAVISGLNISIYTFGERQLPESGDDPAEPLPIAGTEDKDLPPFAFTQVSIQWHIPS